MVLREKKLSFSPKYDALVPRLTLHYLVVSLHLSIATISFFLVLVKSVVYAIGCNYLRCFDPL